MNTTFWIALPVVVAAGTAVTMQASINAALGRALDNTLAAAAVSFGVGFFALVAVTVLSSGGSVLPRLGSASLWMFTGGALGAFYVWASLWGVPVLGVVTMVSALILGQMVGAMVLDAIGAFGLPIRELSASRIAAAVLVAAGVILSRF